MNYGRNSNRIFTRHASRARKLARFKAEVERAEKERAAKRGKEVVAQERRQGLVLMAKKVFRAFTRRRT